jgi:hypothetical protein
MKMLVKPRPKSLERRRKKARPGRARSLLSISIPCFFGYCPCFLGVLQSRLMEAMSPLKLGDAAPEFSLAAANSEAIVSLDETLRKGPAIVEFLRGTW